MIRVQLNNPKSIEDYEAIVAVHNRAWPDNLAAANEWQHHDQQWPHDTHMHQRFVATVDGKLIAEGSILETRWAHVPGKYACGYSSLPDYDGVELDGETVYDAVYAFALDYLAERNPIALVAWSREDKTHYLAWLREHGFRQTMRSAESTLAVPQFDASRFAGLRERLAAEGIEIVPLSELQTLDPNWQRKLYDIVTAIEIDVPSPDLVTPQPFEQFVNSFSQPNFLAEGCFLAVDTSADVDSAVGPYIGLSSMGTTEADPDKLYTWLTGVERPYRRRGIALAIKVNAIEFAQRRGTNVIATGNEENNPMYQINLTLGFESKPAWLDFEKTLNG